jgi:hypothetical protein
MHQDESSDSLFKFHAYDYKELFEICVIEESEQHGVDSQSKL